MWTLQWGDNTNRVSGHWNHEEHESSDKALAAAKMKIGMGLVVQAIHSPAGVQWMTEDEVNMAAKDDQSVQNA